MLGTLRGTPNHSISFHVISSCPGTQWLFLARSIPRFAGFGNFQFKYFVTFSQAFKATVLGTRSPKNPPGCPRRPPLWPRRGAFFLNASRRVPVVHFGGLGVEVCSLDAVLVSATVRNHLQLLAAVVAESCRAYSKSCKRRHYWSFNCDGASFRVAGVALCDMWMRDRGGRRFPRLWEKLQKASFLECTNRVGRAARSGDKLRIPWQAWHFVTCDEIWRKPRTKHRF